MSSYPFRAHHEEVRLNLYGLGKGKLHQTLCLLLICVFWKWGGRQFQVTFLRCGPPWFLRQGISLACSLLSELKRLASEDPPVSISWGGSYLCMPLHMPFYMGSEDLTPTLINVQQTLYQLSLLPSPRLSI